MGVEKEEGRPDPDQLLQELQGEEKNLGHLKIFFGYAAGVGKTFSMLTEAQEKYREGKDVLIGYIEPHTRPETMELVKGLPELPPKEISYRNIVLKEFDLDEALKRKPQLILVDELAHTNAEGSRNRKRYQDIEELLEAGIDVYTTVNVQHIESLNDVVSEMAKVKVLETVPDILFEKTDKIKLIDIEPEELLRRLEEGKIYKPERARLAMQNFFTRENLGHLREIALRKAASQVSIDNQWDRKETEKAAVTKFLVSFGPSPSSAKCIRWTARAAEAFRVEWTALYVEPEATSLLTEEQRKTLDENLDLAEKMGAEIVRLTGNDVGTTLAEYAKIAGITNIVIGKSWNQKKWWNFFQEDLEDRLISLLPDIEFHIISDHKAPRYQPSFRGVFWVPSLRLSWKDTLKMLGCLGAATMLSFGLVQFDLSPQNIIAVHILSVLVVSRITEGYLYGILASLLSVLSFNFFFTVPFFTFKATNANYPITFFIMFLVGLTTSALTARVKTQAKVALDKEQETELLYEITKKLLVTETKDKIIDLVNHSILCLFDRSVIFYGEDPQNGRSGTLLAVKGEDASFLLSSSEQAVAHWSFKNRKKAGHGTDTLMGAGGFYLPILFQGNILGVLGLSCKTAPLNHEEDQLLKIVASLIALALGRQTLSDRHHGLVVESEKEKMRGNLLRAISHDLRTPLTSILGASSTILASGDSLAGSEKAKLISDIQEEAQWLIRMVENLLSVTRIQADKLKVQKEAEAAEEIVAEAVRRIQKLNPKREIAVSVPEKLVWVPMDGTLITQVLLNLLENSLKYSPINEKVEIRLRSSEKYGIFEILDRGKGLGEKKIQEFLKNGYFTESWDMETTRGLGIGLSICLSIVKAHGGQIKMKKREGGGSIFTVLLPLEEGGSHG